VWFPHNAIDFVFVLDMVILYFLLTYSILFHSTSLYSLLFQSFPIWSILLCPILFYSIPLSFILFYSSLFHSVLFFSVLFHSMLLCPILYVPLLHNFAFTSYWLLVKKLVIFYGTRRFSTDRPQTNQPPIPLRESDESHHLSHACYVPSQSHRP